MDKFILIEDKQSHRKMLIKWNSIEFVSFIDDKQGYGVYLKGEHVPHIMIDEKQFGLLVKYNDRI